MKDIKLRIARATNDLKTISKMYCDGLGFKVLGSFLSHDNYDGIMIGDEDSPYHLEFTQEEDVVAPKSNSPDNLLVFYIADKKDFKRSLDRMKFAGFNTVKSKNPYWDLQGQTFEDPDGYRVVLSNQEWK